MGELTSENGSIFIGTSKPTFGRKQPVRRRLRKAKNDAGAPQSGLFEIPRAVRSGDTSVSFPFEDNTPEGLKALLAANLQYRETAWPEPYALTTHRLHRGDGRDLSWIPDASIHLVVTSPPYWTLKQYAPGNASQMGHFEDYEYFLTELDRVWRECRRVLVGGGRICCVVGDVCIPRKRGGRHYIVPLHSDIQVRARRLGLVSVTSQVVRFYY
jgi:site-specific DNA-methyltransferase (adenine-specific)